MATIHKAFMSVLAKTPRLLLLKLVREKLSEQELADQSGLAEALTDHLLNGGGEMFTWDDGRPSEEPPRNLSLSFSEKDAIRLSQLTDEFVGRLPALIERMSKDAAERLAKTLQRTWPEQAIYEKAVLEDFRGRLEARWGRGFDLLRILLTSCRELGGECANRLGRSRSKKNRVLRSLLVRLHARACQIAAEIVTLMENGFADGAMARWRTLHEVSVVATVVADGGEALARRYIEHEIVESKFALDEYGLHPVPKTPS